MNFGMDLQKSGRQHPVRRYGQGCQIRKQGAEQGRTEQEVATGDKVLVLIIK